jgi:hypothetical protein
MSKEDDSSDDRQERKSREQLKWAAKQAQQFSWPKTTMTRSDDCYRVKTGEHVFTIPTPDLLKSQTIDTLRNKMTVPFKQEAELLEACDFAYRLVRDWDGPFEIVEVVITAPRSIYERLQDKRLYANILSVMSTMVCEKIGSDCLECAD